MFRVIEFVTPEFIAKLLTTLWVPHAVTDILSGFTTAAFRQYQLVYIIRNPQIRVPRPERSHTAYS